MTGEGRFTGKVAVVTGGAGGIGRAVCEGFAAQGASVAVLDVRGVQEAAAALSEGYGVSARGWEVDVSDRDAVAAVMDAVVGGLGGLDVLVTLAGGSLGTPKILEEIEPEHVDLVVDVNVKGTFYCAQAALARMPDDGAVVTVSSIGGRQPSPVTGVPYAASKAAVLGMTRRLAREVGGRGQRVNAVAPGLFLTGRLQQMYDEMPASERDEVLDAIPLGRFPELREIVDPVLFLAGPESSYITGVVLDVNGGRFMPL
ncbi:SDR family NAD(P)-dependent oxidoreductase [Ornithinimicrobium avium]|uniref:SDR family NAD(P)-dependent oxidoreductase n=1 Tax=Ornithinimicrobium avium TaxID=2283195 RepID=A0A345NNJ6_9MICO|nr:SDR family NAD(P)-dependent oxidoreductase [Ornithinimicrobium avium]AXH96604.1 SDR family NAD(P)-dependent oxidoreductase [Ornithinimicrobium avium]